MWALLGLLVIAGLGLYFGYIIGVRKERGRHQLIAEIEMQAKDQRRQRSSIKLHTIRVRR